MTFLLPLYAGQQIYHRKEEIVNSYELVVILRPKESEPLTARVKDILSKHGITIVKDDSMGNKRLAYDIDGERDGHYLVYGIDAAPDTVKKVIADFNLISDILRFLFVKTKMKTAASA